jgi:hypothetical protein
MLLTSFLAEQTWCTVTVLLTAVRLLVQNPYFTGLLCWAEVMTMMVVADGTGTP